MQTSNSVAETYCIACALKSLDSSTAIVEKLDREHFNNSKNRIIFDLILALVIDNKEVSNHTVLSLGNETQVFNDLAYLYEITFDEHKIEELPLYIELLIEARKSKLYIDSLKTACSRAESSLKLEDQPEILIQNLETILFESGHGTIKSLKETIEEPFKTSELAFKDFVKDKIKAHAQGIQKLTGISTGFQNLDEATDGLQPSWLYVIGARPSEGKTQFLLNILNNIALQKIPSLFFSLEMPAGDVMSELLSINGGYDHKKMQQGTCTPIDLQKLEYATDLCKSLPIYIDDQPSLNTLQMRMRIKHAIRAHGIKIVFIDYLQEISAIGKFGNHQEKMQEVSRHIREMAKEFNIPIFCAAQVNRESEKNEKIMPPMASQLRESGQIEQCAWFIGMLHRPDKHDAANFPGILELYIRKNRFGIRKKLSYNYFADTPNYSYKIIEIKDVKHEVDAIRTANESTKDAWNDLER